MSDYISQLSGTTDYCGPITMTLRVELDGDDIDTPDFVSLSTINQKIKISTADTDLLGDYKLILTYSLEEFPSVTLEKELMELSVTDFDIFADLFAIEEEVIEEEVIEEEEVVEEEEEVEEEIVIEEEIIEEEEEEEVVEEIIDTTLIEEEIPYAPSWSGISKATIDGSNRMTIKLTDSVEARGDFSGQKDKGLKTRYTFNGDGSPSRYSYSISSFSSSQIVVEFDFDEPMKVSQGSGPLDIMEV